MDPVAQALAQQKTPGARIKEWWQRNGVPSPESAVEGVWGMLPKNVRQVYASAPAGLMELSPGAAIRDTLEESGNLTRATLAGKPVDAATALAGMTLASLGIVPGGRAAKVIKTAGDAAPGIRAYHGSPHDFDKFDLSKIGTGEGAQAYGHGLYFAENPATAAEYRKLGAGFTVDGVNLQGGLQASEAIYNMRGLTREAKDQAAWHINRGYTLDDALKHLDRQSPRDAASLRAAIEKGRLGAADFGKTYEVRINADRDKFLDWDKPLKEQPGAVRDALPSLVSAAPVPVKGPALRNRQAISSLDDSVPGDVLYNNLGGWKDPVGMSRRLRDSGIPGIKYLDGGSRGTGAGTSNFVVFDDKIIDILKKYGWMPAGMAAGGMMMTPPPAEAAPAVLPAEPMP